MREGIVSLEPVEGMGLTPNVRQFVFDTAWFVKSFHFQVCVCAPQSPAVGEAEVSSAGEQLTEE